MNWTQDPCNSSQEFYHWATKADIHSPYIATILIVTDPMFDSLPPCPV